MFQTFHLDTSTRSSNCPPTPTPQLHSCPFCRCRSLDINIKTSPRSSACNIRIAKEVLQTKLKNSRIDGQNVYYRTFQSPKRNGLSPNGNKKIMIQYVSPESTLMNSTAYRPFAKPQPTAINSKTSFIISSPIKTSPRNIYTNENTPPKAKFLQKKSSRKDSHQKMLYNTPVQGLTLVDSERVRKPFIQEEKNSIMLFNNPMQQTRKRQSQQISIKATIDYYPKIAQTQTKNIIKRASGQDSSASPFNSLTDSSPRVAPYASTQSTPMGSKFEITKKEIGPSIKEMMQFGDGSQREVKKSIKESQGILQMKKIEYTPKSVELSPGRSSYSHQKFDKTLGKLKSVQRCHENQLIYSQSDRLTLNYPTSSQHNLPEKHQKNMFPQPFSRSEQIIRPLSQQYMLTNQHKLDALEMSDNFQTPKSKYKTVNQQKKGKVSGGIKFYPLGDNKKGKGSKMSGGKVSDKAESSKSSLRVTEKEAIQVKQHQQQQPQLQPSLKHQQNQKQIPVPVIPQTIPQAQPQPSQPQPQPQASSQPSKLYAAQLAQQLDLNYDYYFYQPVHNPNLYQRHIDQVDTDHRNQARQSSIEESGSVDVTF